MEVTRGLHNLNLLMKFMVLLHQILFDLAIAVNAEVILMWISAEQMPSLDRVAPRNLNLVTFSKFWHPCCLVHAFGYDLALFSADLCSISPCSVYESVDKVLQFVIA